MKRRVGLGIDRWVNGKIGIVIGRDNWGWGKIGGVRVGLFSCVLVVVRMLVFFFVLNEVLV